MSKYGIAEWFGRPFGGLDTNHRKTLARAALKQEPAPPCPFQSGHPRCSKKGGVCAIRSGGGEPVITCPKRFEAGNLLPRWLAEIAGFEEVFMAREVPFMRSPTTRREAGRIDLVVAGDRTAETWFGLEIQAVYFSGAGMEPEFRHLLTDAPESTTETGNRRPDWRSSSAKRLMPQIQVKAPTLRRWGTKLAIAVDFPFFEAIGGATSSPSQDRNDGDIIWLVARMTPNFQLTRHHWEVLSLEDSCEKLLSAKTVKRPEFEEALRQRLKPT